MAGRVHARPYNALYAPAKLVYYRSESLYHTNKSVHARHNATPPYCIDDTVVYWVSCDTTVSRPLLTPVDGRHRPVSRN